MAWKILQGDVLDKLSEIETGTVQTCITSPLWVAEHYGRDSIGIEINPEYCELIKKRMNKFQQTIFQGVTV